MKKSFCKTGMLLLSFATLFSVRAEKVTTLQIGPCWPRVLLDSKAEKKTAWDASLEFGASIDRRVGIGIGADFLWNRYVKESVDTTDNTHSIDIERKNYMFPVFGFFYLDPVPDLIVHPLLKGRIGYNSLIHIFNDDTPAATEANEDNGYYYGLYGKLELDALYDFSENAATFLGLSWTWANTKNGIDNFHRIDMSAFGLTLGFRFLL